MTISRKRPLGSSRSRRAAGIAVVGFLAVGGLEACGSSSTSSQVSQTPQAPAQSAAPVLPTVGLTVIGPSDGAEVFQPGVTLHGTTTRGSQVLVNGQSAIMTGRDWRVPLKLTTGSNSITLRATKDGFTPFSSTMTITRKLSAAEKAAVAQAQAARQAQTEVNFKASAKSISYAELLKDSSPFVGNDVVFRGHILQIQQSGSTGGTMLLSVTDQGYGFWTDNVWVDYDNSTTANQNDVVTVYGTITGTKSYDTQSGGNTYVPQMHALYIDQSVTSATAPTQTPSPTGVPGTVTGTDGAGHNIGISCSDNPNDPLPGCNDGNGRGPASNLSYGSVTGTDSAGYNTGVGCSDNPNGALPRCQNG